MFLESDSAYQTYLEEHKNLKKNNDMTKIGKYQKNLGVGSNTSYMVHWNTYSLSAQVLVCTIPIVTLILSSLLGKTQTLVIWSI